MANFIGDGIYVSLARVLCVLGAMGIFYLSWAKLILAIYWTISKLWPYKAQRTRPPSPEEWHEFLLSHQRTRVD